MDVDLSIDGWDGAVLGKKRSGDRQSCKDNRPMKARITGEKSSWEVFFERSVALNLSDEELSQLHQEYALFPSPSSRKSLSSPLPRTDDEYDEDIAYSEDSEECQSSAISIPLCCEKECLSSLSAHDVMTRQSWLRQMTKREQDISILSVLVVGKRNNNELIHEESRTRFTYRFDNHHI